MITNTDLDKIGKLFEKKMESSLEKNLAPIKEDITQIRKDQKLIVRFFDHEYLDLRKRVEKIERYLKLTESN